jgi:hypothetical protein
VPALARSRGGPRAHAQREDTSPLDPQRGALHRILRLHLAEFLAERERLGAPLPEFVREELSSYLECGVLAAGCALFECDGCGLSRVTALSCRGRGFCPRCCGRRMTQRARHLAERVLPEVRVRQWVLSFPFALRVRLAFDHELTRALVRITTSEIEAHYQALAHEQGLREAQSGAVTVIQRFGSDLAINVHLHIVSLDGAYGTDSRGNVRFFRALAPSPSDVETVLRRIIERANELLCASEREHLEEDELALAQSYAQCVGRSATQAYSPEDGRDDELGLVLLPTRRKARIGTWDPSTGSGQASMPRWPSKNTSASAWNFSAATSCARPSRSIGSNFWPTAAFASNSNALGATAPRTSR